MFFVYKDYIYGLYEYIVAHFYSLVNCFVQKKFTKIVFFCTIEKHLHI